MITANFSLLENRDVVVEVLGERIEVPRQRRRVCGCACVSVCVCVCVVLEKRKNIWNWPAPPSPSRVVDGNRIGHFRVPPSLCIKTGLSSQSLIWKWLFILTQIKLLFTRKVVHLASLWKWGFLELGSGLFGTHFLNEIYVLFYNVFYVCVFLRKTMIYFTAKIWQSGSLYF